MICSGSSRTNRRRGSCSRCCNISCSFKTKRHFTSLDQQWLTQLIKCCIFFIIIQSTSVGSSLMTSNSNTTPATTATSSSSSITSTRSSSSSISWLEGTGADSAEGPYSTPLFDGLPQFAALVEENPNSSHRKTTSDAIGEAINLDRQLDSTSSYDSLLSPRSHILKVLGTATIAPKSVDMIEPSGSGISFRKMTSSNIILTEEKLGEWSTIGTGRTVPVEFLERSKTGKTKSTEQNPSDNQQDAGNVTTTKGNFSKMYFATDNHTTIASQVGSIAVLPCAMRNIGESVVSWIRRNDYHLLTIGFNTYSSDERFNIIHSEDTEEWPLQIKYVQLRDAGLYECQVSTYPPTSVFVKLNVVEVKAEIFGPTEKYLTPGSVLRLTCRIVQSNEPPLYIFWYHNNRMINYDAHRGVNVSTEADNRYSELVISHTNTLNSGNYSCVSNNAVAASTLVHILNGENPAAMQHGDHGNAVTVVSRMYLPLAIVTYQIINYVSNMQ